MRSLCGSVSSFVGSLLLIGSLPARTQAANVLSTNGYSSCGNNTDIKINKMNISYDNTNRVVTFDVAGTSAISQKVMASLTVYAYGQKVYSNSFNPCDADTAVAQLCPIPSGTFAASGTQAIPDSYASMIPAIAFTIPDLDGTAKMVLTPVNDSSTPIACIQSAVSNGKSTKVAAVGAVAAGVAGAALAVSALSSLAVGGKPGTATSSPTFFEVVTWFQSMAMNGMMSVSYPSVYQGFVQNFGFSGLIISWGPMQRSIDAFRAKTGGNLTENSYSWIRNSTLVQVDSSGTVTKRGLEELVARSLSFSSSNDTTTNSTTDDKTMLFVKGIQGYVEELSVPAANTFMTVLLIFAVVIAAVVVGILLFKVILEAWALVGKFPASLTSFRKRYWWVMAKTVTNLILLMYGTWTLFCVYQFAKGDSWVAKVLAGVTLGLFTAILVFFTWKIWRLAGKYKRLEGDANGLYENKETWLKYSLFYDNFKKGYWWMFVPTIVYMFAKGVIIAGADGHGLIQTAGQLVVEAIMLILLLWTRPYTLKSGNWINIIVQIVRVVSVLCILIFVEELGIAQTPKTVVGVVLIVVQASLTGILAILIGVNALVNLCRMNPHRKARKDAEKLSRDLDNLTPLDARNSLLHPPNYQESYHYEPTLPNLEPSSISKKGYYGSGQDTAYRGYTHQQSDSQDRLLGDSQSFGGRTLRSQGSNPSIMDQPLLPSVDPRYRQRGY